MLDYQNPITNLYSLIKQSSEKFKDNIALQFIPDAKRMTITSELTYAQLFININKMINMLYEYGIKSQDVVTLLLPNTPETLMLLLAIESCGAIANPINPSLNPKDIQTILAVTHSKIIATTPEIFSKLKENDPDSNHFFLIFSETHEIYRNYSGNEVLNTSTPESICAYFHTSGTTGVPKLTKLTHKNLIYSAFAVSQRFGYTANDKILCALPLFHVGAPTVSGTAAFLHGAQVIMISKKGWLEPGLCNNFWQLVNNFKITSFTATPFVFNTLIEIQPENIDISSLRHAVSGNILPEVSYHSFHNLTGIYPQEIYGFTESACIASSTLLNEPKQRGTLGIPLPDTEFKILKLDKEGNYLGDCHVDEVGFLCIRGPGISIGYYNVDDHCSSFPLPGWFKIGDLAYLDSDGLYHFYSREADLINTCQNPAKTEKILLQHPAVKQAALIGCKVDDSSDEKPIAFISLHSKQSVTENDLYIFLKNNLTQEDIFPEKIVFKDSLPINAMGKIQKYLLK